MSPEEKKQAKQEREQAKQERDNAVRQVQQNLQVEASQMLAAQSTANGGTAAAVMRAVIQTSHEMGAAHANELAQMRGQAEAAAREADARCSQLDIRIQAAEAKLEELEADKDSP